VSSVLDEGKTGSQVARDLDRTASAYSLDRPGESKA
jgi:hypothetical protein